MGIATSCWLLAADAQPCGAGNTENLFSTTESTEETPRKSNLLPQKTQRAQRKPGRHQNWTSSMSSAVEILDAACNSSLAET
jgi:hypothetical protein